MEIYNVFKHKMNRGKSRRLFTIVKNRRIDAPFSKLREMRSRYSMTRKKFKTGLSGNELNMIWGAGVLKLKGKKRLKKEGKLL